jgi:hypothetical protein
MMSELERWFPKVQPPPGGAARLQMAMTASGDAKPGFWPGYVWAGMAMLAIALSPLAWTGPQRNPQPEEVAVAMDALAAQPARAVRIVGGDAVELAHTDASVRVFLVMTR